MRGLRNGRTNNKTIGKMTKAPRDNVTKKEMIIGTTIKAWIPIEYHFEEVITKNMATSKTAIRKAA
ncbi:hypothetical protein YDYSG_59080 [Paenibacillus tyrfis]|nr:hypothetical protein YDYSG_59080 [Paenibacillus tyrfis]